MDHLRHVWVHLENLHQSVFLTLMPQSICPVPQTYFQEQQAGSLPLTHSSTQFNLAEGSTLEFPYNSGSNLPLMLPPMGLQLGLTYKDACVLGNDHLVYSFMSIADEMNLAPQMELLLCHWYLGHANMQWVQQFCHSLNDPSQCCAIAPKHPTTSSGSILKCTLVC